MSLRQPLEDHFRPLRDEADRLRDSLADLRKAIGASTSTGGRSSGSGSGDGGSVGLSANAMSTFAAGARDVSRSVRDIQGALKGMADVAKGLGFRETARGLDSVQQKVEIVGDGVRTVSSISALIATAWGVGGEILVGITAAAAAVGSLGVVLLGVQEKAKGIGLDLDLTQTVDTSVAAITRLAANLSGGPLATILNTDVGQGTLGDMLMHLATGRGRDHSQSLVDQLVSMLSTFKDRLLAIAHIGDRPVLDEMFSPQSFQQAKQSIADLKLALAKLYGDPNAVASAMRAQLDAQLAPLREQAQVLSNAIPHLGSDAAEGQRRLNALNEEITLRGQVLEATIAQNAAQAANNTEFGRFRAGLADMANFSANAFDLARQSIESLSGAIAKSLVDAFVNPQADIRETFRDLIQFMIEEVIRLMIQMLITKAILLAMDLLIDAATGGAGAPAAGVANAFVEPVVSAGVQAGGNAIGRARGGLIPDVGGSPVPGLAASDTVPAMLTPGEFVQSLKAVHTYGLDVMQALNEGRIDPGIFGGMRLRSFSPPSSPRVAFATGGMVSGASMSAGHTVLPVIATSPATLEHMLNGGEAAVLRFFEKHASKINARLGR